MIHAKTPINCLAALAVSFGLTASPARADEEQEPFLDDEPIDFAFGDDCEKLEDLTYEGLQMLVVAASDRDEEQFCAVSMPFDCADFDEAVAGFGALRPSVEGGFCRFVPELRRSHGRDFFIGQL